MIELENGLSIRQVAESAFNAFRNALGHKDHWGQELATWNHVNFDAQEAWISAVDFAITEITHPDGLAWKELAKRTYEAWAKEMGYDFDFEVTYPETRVAWIAVVKHIANVMALEEPDEEELKEHETSWLNYSERYSAA